MAVPMVAIAREEPDPKLDLLYPEHWGSGGHNCFYPYRPLAAFTDRLTLEEQRRQVEANKQRRAREEVERQLERKAT